MGRHDGAPWLAIENRDVLKGDMNAEAVSGKKILIVEDEEGSRLSLAAMLTDCDADVTAVGDAEDALAAIEAALPDAVISDIELPGMDGFYFIQKLRERETKMGAPCAPAVALSAHADKTYQLRAVGEGFQMHVAKPVDPAGLLRVLDRLLSRGRAPPRLGRGGGAAVPAWRR
ncbi:MAG: response regulator [Pararobbsia sp.]